MSYFADSKSESEYLASKGLEGYNIGWLDKVYEYPRGNVSEKVLNKLLELCINNSVNRMRSFHDCSFCHECKSGTKVDSPYTVIHDGEKHILGSGEIWVRGEGNIIYIAPNLIYHYIKDHNYKPPDDFLLAVENEITVDEKFLFGDDWIDI